MDRVVWCCGGVRGEVAVEVVMVMSGLQAVDATVTSPENRWSGVRAGVSVFAVWPGRLGRRSRVGPLSGNELLGEA